jgi:hypothetical protein
MAGTKRPWKRREFLTKGIMGGALLITYPAGNTIPKGLDFQNPDSLELVKLARRYGAEFGPLTGGF